MDGIAVIVVAGLYVALLVFAMRWAWHRGLAKGGSWIKASFYSLLAFLAVYLPAFWNHLPAARAYRAMCTQDAGFTQRVAPDDWLKANHLRVIEVKGTDLDAIQPLKTLSSGFVARTSFGGLLRSESKQERLSAFSVPIMRIELRLVDNSTGSILATSVDYLRGNRESLSPWLYRPSCSENEIMRPVEQFIDYGKRLRGEMK